MEKITIGKFIAALRRANGMTQRELGEKLFVSDKTVSRWECDECTPDLSLIPTIAEIFGITTDELLRGERNNYERERSCDESSGKQKAKRDKQFRLMLDINKRKYKNLTLISFGITILGFIFAMVANLGFSEGLIAFCFTAAFCAASEICQICFAVNARILPDDDDAEYAEKIEKVNTGIAETVVKFTFFNIAVLAFSLPLVTLINGVNYGMLFESWLVYGLLFSAIAFVLSFVLYMFSVHKMLCDRGIIIISQDEAKTVSENKALVKKIIAISVSVAILLCIGNIVLQEIGKGAFVEKLVFDNCADFKIFVESDYERWYREGYSYYDKNGNYITEIPVFPSGEDPDEVIEANKVYDEIKDVYGNVICEYFYNPDLYTDISFTESDADRMPVTVITRDAYHNGVQTYNAIESFIYILIAIDFISAVAIYIINVRKKNPSRFDMHPKS